ncbi:MAG: DUF3592 domain-containing protein [Janthinobacterium lividum]
MEALIEHALEPEMVLPAPRKLHLPFRGLLLLSVAGLLLLLFAIGSGRALWEGVKLSWLTQAGHTVNGKIVDIQSESAPRGQMPQQTAIYYSGDIPGPHGLIHQGGWIVLGAPSALPGAEMMSVKPKVAPDFRLNQLFPLRYATLMGMTLCQPWGPDPGSRIVTLFLTGGLVMLVSLFLLRRLLRWIGSRLHLLRQGTATIGTITHKRSEAEDMIRYFLRYGYADTSAQGCDREEQVSAEQWHQFHVGQPVTVLYDPEQPNKAGLYALIAQK